MFRVWVLVSSSTVATASSGMETKVPATSHEIVQCQNPENARLQYVNPMRAAPYTRHALNKPQDNVDYRGPQTRNRPELVVEVLEH